MIVDAVVGWFVSFASFAASAIPPLPDSVIVSLDGFDVSVAQVAGFVANFGPVVPFTEIGLSLAMTAAFWALAIVLQVTRIAASFVTLGGGSV